MSKRRRWLVVPILLGAFVIGFVGVWRVAFAWRYPSYSQIRVGMTHAEVNEILSSEDSTIRVQWGTDGRVADKRIE